MKNEMVIFLIGLNDQVGQLEVYIPSLVKKKVRRIDSNKQLEKIKTYNKVSTNAKQVKFSDFKETDSVILTFEN